MDFLFRGHSASETGVEVEDGMAEAFPVSGNIDPQSFPHLLVDLHRHGATGSLKVNGPVHPKALYFRGGRVLFGSSNDPKDQLGAILIESGRITRDQLDEVNGKVGPGNPLAKVLAESGFVNQRELGEAARMKVERILADVLAWDSGTFEFEDGVLPKGAVDLKLSTEKLLLAAVQRVADRPFALRHLELSNVLEPSLEGESALSEIRADVWPVLERIDGRRTLKDAIALTRLDEFEAMKTACAMFFLGIVRKKAGAEASGEVDLAEEAQSGFGQDEGPMYTVPLQSVAVADLPARGGFASESVAGFVAPESEPAPALASFDVPPQAEQFPEVEPDEPPVFTAETTMLPGQAPIFTMADYIKRAETEAKPEERMAFEPKTEEPSPETVYAMPAPSFSSSPPPSPAPPPEETPEEYSSAAPTLIVPEAPSFASEPTGTVYSPFTPLRPSATAPPNTVEPPPPPVPSYAGYGAADSEPVGVLPEHGFPTPAPAASKPRQENLAALDALLNPGAVANRAASERPRQDRFEPQFRPPPRHAAARTAASSTSRLPLIFAGLAGVLLATVAAWYFLLRTPEPQASPQQAPPTTVAAAPTTTLPPPTLAATTAPTLAASTAATPAPVAAATPTAPPPTPVPAIPKPTAAAPTPSPRPAATPPPAATARTGGDGPTLLRQGSFAEAAKSFATSLAPGARGRFSNQLLTACSTDTIAKAVQAVPGDELFILPVMFQGRSCYRLCWGVYDTRPAAEAGRNSVPAYFRQSGTTPRLSPLNELLP
jgi:Domain of unknown function (DUF4388)